MDGQRGGPRDGRRRPSEQGAGAGQGAESASGSIPDSDAPTSKPFDPRTYLRQIRVRGGQTADYLDVKWRLVWLRSEHPDAQIQTEHVSLSQDSAVFKASVEIPGGGCATGYGSESRGDFADFIEKAETKAIGRALAALGYGTQFALDFDLEDETDEVSGRLADAPVERASQPAERAPATPPTLTAPTPTISRVRAVPPPSEFEPQSESASEPVPIPEPAREPRRRPEQRPEPATDDEPGEPRALGTLGAEERVPTNLRAIRDERPPAGREPFEPADYSWTEFWKWARVLGYKSRTDLGELLGIEVDEMTPHEVRRRLIEYRRDQGLDT